MLRKIAIGLAAATFAMGGSALSASTDHGAAGAPSAGKGQRRRWPVWQRTVRRKYQRR
jgi:hypothetical protein